jgi:hypothetical protein
VKLSFPTVSGNVELCVALNGCLLLLIVARGLKKNHAVKLLGVVFPGIV